jgi:hypothetical protein
VFEIQQISESESGVFVAAGKTFNDEWSVDSDVVAGFCVGRGD